MIFRVENKKQKNQDIPAVFIPREGDWNWEHLSAARLLLRLHLAWEVWTTIGLLVLVCSGQRTPLGPRPGRRKRDVQMHKWV